MPSTLLQRVLGQRAPYGMRPSRQEFAGINLDSSQAQNLSVWFPMWDGAGAAAIDLVNGVTAAPINTIGVSGLQGGTALNLAPNLSRNDPYMGVVYYGDQGGVPRGGGGSTVTRTMPITNYPWPLDPGGDGVAGSPNQNPVACSWQCWVNFNIDGYVIQGLDICNVTDNTPPNQYMIGFAGSTGTFPGWGFGVSNDDTRTAGNNIFIELDVDGVDNQTSVFGKIPLNDGKGWHLITAAYEPNGNSVTQNGATIQLYVDDQLDTAFTAAIPGIQSPAQGTWEAQLGSDGLASAVTAGGTGGVANGQCGAQWNGMFCDIRFYKGRYLTLSDVKASFYQDNRWELYYKKPPVLYSFAKPSVAPPSTNAAQYFFG